MEIYTNSNNQVFISKMALLTDQILASGVTLNDLFHIVITGDTSQNPAGSSYKATVQQFAQAIGSIGFSGGTVIYPTYFTNGLSANTFFATTYLNLPKLPYLPLSGGTVSGSTNFTGGLSANTFSATTYLNLPRLLYLPLSGGTVSGGTIFTSGLTANTFSATTYLNLPILSYLPLSGGTVTGGTNFTGGLSANTFSATTYLNLPRLPYLPLSGGTVTGNTYFGATSGITIDQVNNRLGINTANPQYTIDAFGTKSNVSYQDTSGGVFQISGGTLLPRFSVVGSPSVTRPLFSLSMGVRTYDDVTFPGYGKVGDGHLYGSNEMNGLNIINRQGSGTTEDYIRFYAGQDANGTIPDIHIQGSGSTRGYVGIGTTNPTELLDVSGKTKVINLQMTSGAIANYIMVSDASGNAIWSGLTPSQIPTRYYGSFTSNVTQTNPVGNVARAFSADTTEINNGVILSANTRFVVQNAGVYNIQFSAQLQQLNNSDSAISIWFRKSGTNIPRSNTELSIDKNQGGASKLVAAWNIIESFTANQYIEIMWSSPDTGMEILWQAAGTGPTRPVTPSIIVTVTQV